jgi:hypothetical protein
LEIVCGPVDHLDELLARLFLYSTLWAEACGLQVSIHRPRQIVRHKLPIRILAFRLQQVLPEALDQSVQIAWVTI